MERKRVSKQAPQESCTSDDMDYLGRVKHAFVNYQEDTINKYSYQQKLLSSANLKHKDKLLQSGFGEYLENLLNCVQANQTVLNEILKFSLLQFGESSEVPFPLERRTLRLDNYRVNDMLSAVAKEWSHEGKLERDYTWGPILKEISEYMHANNTDNNISKEMEEVHLILCNTLIT